MAVAEYNMKVSAQHCDWGVLHVGDDKLNVLAALERSSGANNVTLQFVDKAYTADEALRKFVSKQSEYDAIKTSLGDKFESIGVPKSFLLMQIIPYARKYNYVWLLDSDITFEQFQIDEYFNTMRNLPQSPLLLQPVVGTNDRPHTKLNENYYASKSVPGHIAPSNIIEIMLPMIDSAFLVWFSNFFIKPMLGIAYAVSGDFGSDLIWCRASALYLEIGLDVKDYKTRANAACIVITHTPIQHLDWDELPKNSKNDASRLSEMYLHLLDGVKQMRLKFLSGTDAEKIDGSKIVAEQIKERKDARSKQEKWRDEHPDHPASIAYAKKEAEKAAKIAAVEATEAEEEEINEQNQEVTTGDILKATGATGVQLDGGNEKNNNNDKNNNIVGGDGTIADAPIQQIQADLPLNPDHHAMPGWMAGIQHIIGG